MTDWPHSDLLALFDLTQEDVDALYEVFKPIAASLNLTYTWHREGNQVTFMFAR